MAAIPAKNPLIHKNLAATFDPSGKIIKVQRGYMQTEDGKRRLNFLFNPSSDVNVTYGLDVDNGTFNIMNAVDTRDTGKLRILPNQTLTLNLLFDRMYEVWEGSMPEGCELDMNVARAIVGLFDTVSGGAGDTGITAPTTGIMLFSPVDVVLAPSKYAPRFFGVVSTMSINYEILSRDQVPLRASLSMQLRLMPKTTFSNPNAGPVTQNSNPRTPTSDPNSQTIIPPKDVLLNRYK